MYLGTNPLPPPPVPPIQGFCAVLHEGRSDLAQLLCSVFLLVNGPGLLSLDAWRAARKFGHAKPGRIPVPAARAL